MGWTLVYGIYVPIVSTDTRKNDDVQAHRSQTILSDLVSELWDTLQSLLLRMPNNVPMAIQHGDLLTRARIPEPRCLVPRGCHAGPLTRTSSS